MSRVKKNWVEWAVFGVSLMLVLGVLGALVREALVIERKPAELEVRLGQVELHAGRYGVPVTVENHGGQPAEGVLVEVVLEGGGRELERGELEIQFVPRRSHRQGKVVFETDPRQAEKVRGRIVGYETP